MTFLHPYYLLLLLLLVPLVAWYVWKNKSLTAKVQFSSLKAFDGIKRSPMEYLRHLPFVLRCLVLVFVALTLARPQRSDNWSNRTTEGIDIVMWIPILTKHAGIHRRQDGNRRLDKSVPLLVIC
ncbi:MAG: BatA domain-containing protein [Paludibacteraceae bacterium]|nr:BatA domain-containing protein [Paludibacteraceae bacterium]